MNYYSVTLDSTQTQDLIYSLGITDRLVNMKEYIEDFLKKANSNLKVIGVIDAGVRGTLASIKKDEDAMKIITRNIMLAADHMAQAGSSNTDNVAQWVSIQSELRKGINLIIEAYRRYIDLHGQICQSIEDYAKTMIGKYEQELSVIDQMTVPTTKSDHFNTTSPEWTKFMNKFLYMLIYARAHQHTLQTANFKIILHNR